MVISVLRNAMINVVVVSTHTPTGSFKKTDQLMKMDVVKMSNVPQVFLWAYKKSVQKISAVISHLETAV